MPSLMQDRLLAVILALQSFCLAGAISSVGKISAFALDPLSNIHQSHESRNGVFLQEGTKIKQRLQSRLGLAPSQFSIDSLDPVLPERPGFGNTIPSAFVPDFATPRFDRQFAGFLGNLKAREPVFEGASQPFDLPAPDDQTNDLLEGFHPSAAAFVAARLRAHAEADKIKEREAIDAAKHGQPSPEGDGLTRMGEFLTEEIPNPIQGKFISRVPGDGEGAYSPGGIQMSYINPHPELIGAQQTGALTDDRSDATAEGNDDADEAAENEDPNEDPLPGLAADDRPADLDPVSAALWPFKLDPQILADAARTKTVAQEMKEKQEAEASETAANGQDVIGDGWVIDGDNKLNEGITLTPAEKTDRILANRPPRDRTKPLTYDDFDPYRLVKLEQNGQLQGYGPYHPPQHKEAWPEIAAEPTSPPDLPTLPDQEASQEVDRGAMAAALDADK